MSRTPVIWGAGLAVSLAAHVAAAAVLVWATRPDKVPVQQPPETELELAAYQVPRSEARKTEPEAQQATSGDTGGTRVDQNAIAVSRSDPRIPKSVQISPRPDSGQVVAEMPMPADRQSPVSPTGDAVARVNPVAQTVAAQATETTVAAAVATRTEPAEGVSPAAASVTPLVAPATAVAPVQAMASIVTATLSPGTALAPIVNVAMRVEPAQPVAAAAPAPVMQAKAAPTVTPDVTASLQSTLSAARVEQTPSAGEHVEQVTPPAERSRASLAFAAAGNGPVDPVSLTAFQSFMAPGDLGQQAAEVRDSISATLSAVPCSRLQVRYDPDENAVIMTGHVPEAELRNTVLEAMQVQMGADIPVREDLLVLPRPQCGALSGIANVGLPQSTDQITNPLLLGENTHAREFTYVDGDALVLDLQGADYDAYVYVDFFDAGGNVLHLMPNEFTPMRLTEARTTLKIGADRELSPGEPGLYIKIGPPYGQEIAVAFAASDPLYDGVRPIVEPAQTYLDWLQGQVSEARRRNPDFKGEWVYFFVSTAAR